MLTRHSTRFLRMRFARLVCVVGLCVGVVGGAIGLGEYWRAGSLEQERTIAIARGMPLVRIARELHEIGAIRQAWYFVFVVRVLRLENALQAGDYAIPSHASLRRIVALLREGRTISHSVTIPEGLTMLQIVELLEQAPHLSGTIGDVPAEGHVLPETYNYRNGDSRQSVLLRMEQAMTRLLSQEWERAGQEVRRVLKSAEEALILASLIERETGVASERRRVSGVFYNRLQRDMKLQTDPTLVYWESGKRGVLGRGLRQSELKRVHPYNTYVYKGLPPTPIANPGHASILAALRPIASEDLFFVADGKGGHRFAKSLAEHVRNVRLWRGIETRQKASGASKRQNPKNTKAK